MGCTCFEISAPYPARFPHCGAGRAILPFHKPGKTPAEGLSHPPGVCACKTVLPPACGWWEMVKKPAALQAVKRESSCGKMSLELRTFHVIPKSRSASFREVGLDEPPSMSLRCRQAFGTWKTDGGEAWAPHRSLPGELTCSQRGPGCGGGARLTMAKGQLWRVTPVTLNGFHDVQLCTLFSVSSLTFP